ncbi:MAG: twin-arginine translocase TatA/TatE family subunit, partial [Verrucomicrobiota bacterium]
MMPGPIQIAIIVFVIILLFGAKKLPQLARSMGESINEFKKGKEESDLREQVA